eukprot:scaffold630_cov399-Prasinococcus_capsulatus_cf.AAC.9
MAPGVPASTKRGRAVVGGKVEPSGAWGWRATGKAWRTAQAVIWLWPQGQRPATVSVPSPQCNKLAGRGASS